MREAYNAYVMSPSIHEMYIERSNHGMKYHENITGFPMTVIPQANDVAALNHQFQLRNELSRLSYLNRFYFGFHYY
jgi:hypothetical protein